ncbi:uncharacterized protein LOC120796406 [Xiphias gladius]|uniref:uncharacterized protein LOC120796406 n=1 Tax=Xiphias gladius TaxID=8245 RepID=UPI001A99233B|nr:uncharacterized protein LOC120796406 [Xiphias gladius]
MITFQLTSRMAGWFPASQLLLIALLSWNVHCFPAKKGWSQHNPYEGSFSNLETPPGLHYSSSQGAPVQSTNVNPPVWFFHEPVEEGVYSSPKTYPARSSPPLDTSSETSWNVAPGWDPVEESTTAHSVSRTSQPRPGIEFPPPPPLFQAGELEHYEENFEHGNLERETEELNLLLLPPPPLPPYLGPDFKAGELSHYESIYEHGNEERETEEQGLKQLPPYELSAGQMSDSHLQPVPPSLGPVGPSQYYLFLTGQLPPGTVSHFQSDYETGSDHWDEDHYERYHFPIAQSPIVTTRTQEVPSDALWQQPQDYYKS